MTNPPSLFWDELSSQLAIGDPQAWATLEVLLGKKDGNQKPAWQVLYTFVRQDNPRAWSLLYKVLAPIIKALVRKHTGYKDKKDNEAVASIASEVLQEVLTYLLLRLRGIPKADGKPYTPLPEQIDNFLAYLIKACIRRIMTYAKREGKHDSLPTVDAEEEEVPKKELPSLVTQVTPASEYEEEDLRLLRLQLIGKLGKRCQVLMHLKLSGLKPQQILAAGVKGRHDAGIGSIRSQQVLAADLKDLVLPPEVTETDLLSIPISSANVLSVELDRCSKELRALYVKHISSPQSHCYLLSDWQSRRLSLTELAKKFGYAGPAEVQAKIDRCLNMAIEILAF
jgi:DNA-directed RNA polymerase specialized sigma24 family protein